jgi:hypothetical protein
MTLSLKATDALLRALTYIHEHPEEWDQECWIRYESCGTAACVAGHLVLQHPAYPPKIYSDGEVDPEHVRDASGRTIHVAEAARWILLEDSTDPDADGETVDNLFNGINSEEDLWDYASELSPIPLRRPS